MIKGMNEWRHDLEENPRLDGDNEGEMLVVQICKKRRHRSVAARQGMS